jgi:RHS repeat-associated protein
MHNTSLQYFYHPDHLGSASWITDADGNGYQHLQYLPFGESWVEQRLGTYNTPYQFSGKEKDEETGYNYFGARYYDSELSVWLSVDPMSAGYPYQTPYCYVGNRPVIVIDPNGMYESTHTDEDGNVVAVYDDGDFGVYKHSNTALVGFDPERMSLNKVNGEKMGETEYLDEFINPESGKVMTEYKIQFDKSFDPIIEELNNKAKKEDLIQIMLKSTGGKEYDIKSKYRNVGGKLGGKYVTSRSAGNYLAGKNAANGTLLGSTIEYSLFQKLAGALHVDGMAGVMKVLTLGTHYGRPPRYGESYYQYRMSIEGWESTGRVANAW